MIDIFKYISKFFFKKKNHSTNTLNIYEVYSYEEYNKYLEINNEEILARREFEMSLIKAATHEFKLGRYCYVCKKYSDLLVDFNYAYNVDGVLIPNWRERLVCSCCHLNNRMRATAHIFSQELHPNSNSRIYLTEQMTSLYRWFHQSYDNVTGSEYLGEAIQYGTFNKAGIRNESFTRLSFEAESFDYILSFDVLEHIPEYRKAILECYRCLKPKGVFYFSVPFVTSSEKNIVRAFYSETGDLVHLFPPEYHGNPIDSAGCLCFYHFGWELLREIKRSGFEEVKALIYWSDDFGYLGGEHIIFVAKKSS
jgi:hypothetical protein